MKRGLHKPLLTLIFLNGLFLNAFSQDIHFSQFFETPLLKNPALAGIFSGDVRVQSVYRNQWNSVTTPYQTGALSVEYKKPVGKSSDYITYGGQILYDKAGTVNLQTTSVLPTINYNKSLNGKRSTYLSLAFMGGVVQRSIDRSKITTNSQFDGTGFNPNLSNGETFAKSTYSYFDGSVGMSFNSQIGNNSDNNFFVGLAYHHFNKVTKNSFYGNPNYEMIPKWDASIGVRMNVNDYSFFTLYTDYSKQGMYQEIIGGALFSWRLDELENPKYILHIGGFLRWQDAFIPVTKLEFKPFAISFSYDANISQLKSASNGFGGFECSLTYQKYFKTNNIPQSMLCPKF